MNSQLIETEALVLRNLRFGETSRIVTLFTLELGKLGAIAKGARDPKSAFGASLELCLRSGFVIYFRSGRDLQLLKCGWVEAEYPSLWRNPRRYVHASALLEFLDRVLMEEEPFPAVYHLAVRGLERLAHAPEEQLPELFRALQLRTAALLGYAPLLDACFHCRRPLPEDGAGEEEAWCFVVAEGNVLCGDCSHAETGFRLHPRALRRLRAMAQGSGAGTRASSSGERALRVSESRAPSPGWIQAVDVLVEEFLRFHLERYRGLRSLEVRGRLETPLGGLTGAESAV